MKKFKDTKIGNFLKDKAPHILDIVGDVLPDKGALGIVKGIIDRDDKLSESDKAELQVLGDQELDELEAHIRNTADARKTYRETDNQQANKIANDVIKKNLYMVLALVVVQVAVIMFIDSPVAAVVTGVIGTVSGALLQERNTIINFFFGSSMGSKEKDKKLVKK